MKVLKFLLILFSVTLAMQSCESSSSHIIKIDLQSETTIKPDVKDFIVTLYGYSPILADVEATEIVSKKYKAKSLPHTIEMEIPADPASKIRGCKEVDKANYYLSLKWDSNGDGKVGLGDINIDYEKNFPKINIEAKEVQIINVRVID